MRILLITYDNNSFIHYFPLGIAYVASKMRQEGHDVEIYPQDVYHYPESHLIECLGREHYDVVGLGMCGGYYQYDKFLDIVTAVRLASNAEIWAGGHLVSPDPEYFEEFVDKVFVGEYDYEEDLERVGTPAWDLFDIDYYGLIRFPLATNSDRCMPVLSGRGCPFKCNFCYRMEEGHRARSHSSIVEEIRHLRDRYEINYIDFADELLMINPDRTIELSEALKPLGIKWMCNGRLNHAKPKVLKAMKDAGCVFINYGIESVDDEVLRNMNKQLSYNQILKGVRRTLEEGISPGLNMIWGNYGDTKKSLWQSVEFLLKYDDHAQLRTIRPVTPYPGSDLFNDCIRDRVLEGTEDFYEKNVNSDLLTVNFTNLTDDEFHSELHKANKVLANRYFKEKQKVVNQQMVDLYENKNANFRGFRQT